MWNETTKTRIQWKWNILWFILNAMRVYLNILEKSIVYPYGIRLFQWRFGIFIVQFLRISLFNAMCLEVGNFCEPNLIVYPNFVKIIFVTYKIETIRWWVFIIGIGILPIRKLCKNRLPYKQSYFLKLGTKFFFIDKEKLYFIFNIHNISLSVHLP